MRVITKHVAFVVGCADLEKFHVGVLSFDLDRSNLVNVFVACELSGAFVGTASGIAIDVDREGHGLSLRLGATWPSLLVDT